MCCQKRRPVWDNPTIISEMLSALRNSHVYMIYVLYYYSRAVGINIPWYSRFCKVRPFSLCRALMVYQTCTRGGVQFAILNWKLDTRSFSKFSIISTGRGLVNLITDLDVHMRITVFFPWGVECFKQFDLVGKFIPDSAR